MHLTKKDVDIFTKQATDLYDQFYFTNDCTYTLDKAVDMLKKISRLWFKLTFALATTDNVWSKGDKIICEAIGETVLYWHTDMVCQLSFINDLSKLALKYINK